MNNYLLLFYSIACFLMFFSISGLFILSERHILALSIPGFAAFTFPLYLITKRFSLSFTRAYRLEAPDLVTSGLVLFTVAGVIYPVDAISSIFERRRPPESDYISFLLAIKPKGLWSFIGVAFGTIVAAPFTEELLFRGFIQRIFMRNMNGPTAVALAALIFGLAHFSLPILPTIFLLGIIFGYFFYRTGNLVYPMIAHAGYNFVSFLRLHYAPEETIQAAEPGTVSILWTFLSVIALIFALGLFERHISAQHAGER